MPHEIIDQNALLDALRRLEIASELFEVENGKQKYASDLEVIVEGKDYSNGKKVGPYMRLLVYASGEEIMRQGDWGGNTFYLAVEGVLDVYVKDKGGAQKKINRLEPGGCFGEMAVLAGVERNATIAVPAGGTATVIEISRPALRILRKLPKFGHTLDATYRRHGISHTLEEMAQAAGQTVAAPSFETLADAAFMVYGKHHVLCQSGATVEKIVVVKDGWVRCVRGVALEPSSLGVVRGMDTEDAEICFLGAGSCLGLEAIDDREARWNYTAAVLARTEVLEIPVAGLRADAALREKFLKLVSGFTDANESLARTQGLTDARSLAATEEEITTGIVDGVNLLVMDMDLCVRCGNCSLACHKVHGQSRLLRRGIHIERPVKLGSRQTQHLLSPQVCMHCKDPECLTGCPTGAIFRESNGQVDINPHTCIGCFDCATQCPYDAISMIARADDAPAAFNLTGRLKNLLSLAPAALPPPAAESDEMVAIKCNLCENTPLNPAGRKSSRKAYSCEENCPTGALVRVNPHEYFNEITNTLGLVYRDRTHAIGRNIHKRDTIARLWHAGGWLGIIALTLATLWALGRYGYETPITGTWLTMRWATGLVGLLGIAGVMSYSMRRQVYRRRAGALRYWMLAHVYLGVAAGIIILLHGGTTTGGMLTTALHLSFDLTVASGLFGIACYFVVPRIMTSIEGEPLLIEDLEGRRDELRAALDAVGATGEAGAPLRRLIVERVKPRFGSFVYLWRQYVRPAGLKALLADARAEFRDEADRLEDREDRAAFMEAVEVAATLRRVESLILLHRLLKLWLAPHVVSTSLMLALMLVHIGQVVFFNVG